MTTIAYRLPGNQLSINIDGAMLRAADDGFFRVDSGSRAESVLLAGGAQLAPAGAIPGDSSDVGLTQAEVSGVRNSGLLQNIQTPFAQSAVPTILLSSATSISATGAITGLTALPYVPQGVVRVCCFAQTGLAAGLYYARFSSTTSCQLYVDAAGSITPTGITAGAYEGGTGTVTLASVSVPGGAMGPNGSLRIRVARSVPNNANNKTGTITFGGTLVGSWVAVSGVGIVNETRTITNRGVNNVQSVFVGNYTASGSSTVSTLQTQVDSSQAQALAIAGALSNAADYLILEGYTIEILYGA